MIVIVTGARGSGCGRAISARFARDGASIVVSDIDEGGGRQAESAATRRSRRFFIPLTPFAHTCAV